MIGKVNVLAFYSIVFRSCSTPPGVILFVGDSVQLPKQVCFNYKGHF